MTGAHSPDHSAASSPIAGMSRLTIILKTSTGITLRDRLEHWADDLAAALVVRRMRLRPAARSSASAGERPVEAR